MNEYGDIEYCYIWLAIVKKALNHRSTVIVSRFAYSARELRLELSQKVFSREYKSKYYLFREKDFIQRMVSISVHVLYTCREDDVAHGLIRCSKAPLDENETRFTFRISKDSSLINTNKSWKCFVKNLKS